MTIKVEGGAALAAQLALLSRKVKDEVDREIGDVAAEAEGDIVLSVQGGKKTGKVYTRGGVSHQASAAGEAPASDTGGLAGSINHEREKNMRWSVFSRMMTSVWLEYGTEHIEARPFFRPVFAKINLTFRNRIQSAIKRASNAIR